MIIGSGDIASVLPDSDLLFFASGVSNSQETRDIEFGREMSLLLDQPRDKHIVYFSSLAIFYSETPYTIHKRRMEEIIKMNFKKYTIIRIGNITWGDNPHTIINYFKMMISQNQKFPIQNTFRYVIDLDEFLHWVDLIPEWSCEMNCPGTKMKVSEIVQEIKNGTL